MILGIATAAMFLSPPTFAAKVAFGDIAMTPSLAAKKKLDITWVRHSGRMASFTAELRYIAV